MDDANERTWRAGYTLFRALTQATLGRENEKLTAEERAALTVARVGMGLTVGDVDLASSDTIRAASIL